MFFFFDFFVLLEAILSLCYRKGEAWCIILASSPSYPCQDFSRTFCSHILIHQLERESLRLWLQGSHLVNDHHTFLLGFFWIWPLGPPPPPPCLLNCTVLHSGVLLNDQPAAKLRKPELNSGSLKGSAVTINNSCPCVRWHLSLVTGLDYLSSFWIPPHPCASHKEPSKSLFLSLLFS